MSMLGGLSLQVVKNADNVLSPHLPPFRPPFQGLRHSVHDSAYPALWHKDC